MSCSHTYGKIQVIFSALLGFVALIADGDVDQAGLLLHFL